MGPSIQKILSVFSITGLLILAGCSNSLTELKSSSVSVIFDYEEEDKTPTVHLAAFTEPSNNVRRCKSLTLICNENNYKWNTEDVFKFQFNNKYYAGFANFMMPEGEKVQNGKYELYYCEADESEYLYSTILEYNNSFYDLKTDEAQKLINQSGFTQKLAVYNANQTLLYFGEYKSEFRNKKNILRNFTDAESIRVVWISGSGTEYCLMPAEKIVEETKKEE